jgi:polysaccharide biosynthesis/export protein
MKSIVLIGYLTLGLTFLIFSSCSGSRDAVYFNSISSGEFPSTTQSLEPVIQSNDLLSISVTSLNPEASEVFNTLNSNNARSANTTSTISQAPGYLVDTDGNIKFPYLGNIRAAGLTKKTLQEGIKEELVKRKLLLDPIIDIRYLNYKVSVLGEVARPSLLTVPNERITLLEALSLAGDLTIYARRDNILLIREEEGKKKLTRIDLTNNDLFTSPYYYLKTNDIVYVEPNKTKISNASATRQWLPIVLSALSLGVIAVDRLTR